MQKQTISATQLDSLLEKISAAGQQVYVPQQEGEQLHFKPMAGPADIVRDYIQTTRSAKAVLFPPVEQLLSYRHEGADISVQDSDLAQIPQVVLYGVRPCDAAAISSLNAVFTNDYKDALFAARLEKLTVISLSCSKADADCFCTSVGLHPGASQGSDILLTPLQNGGYLAEILTPKGEALVKMAPEWFKAATATDVPVALATVAPKFDFNLLREKLATAFEHPHWQQASLACLGCGACTYVCPICSCFDIQDEGSRKQGHRLRSWDSCGLALFTLHTSGHNPRHIQSERWRQRLMHKFSYMPDQLQVLGCVGCGRCSRVCPADMNLVEQIDRVLSALG
jgi:sulfhydrogenase subunit beta (sulfur reductase)